jgi:hypothetical protein
MLCFPSHRHILIHVPASPSRRFRKLLAMRLFDFLANPPCQCPFPWRQLYKYMHNAFDLPILAFHLFKGMWMRAWLGIAIWVDAVSKCNTSCISISSPQKHCVLWFCSWVRHPGSPILSCSPRQVLLILGVEWTAFFSPKSMQRRRLCTDRRWGRHWQLALSMAEWWMY